jgi:hypothetical protein
MIVGVVPLIAVFWIMIGLYDPSVGKGLEKTQVYGPHGCAASSPIHCVVAVWPLMPSGAEYVNSR